ncbi:hypothetical protein MVEN_00361100 [Mycena venus]|uniref:Peptidase C14 caspase domain-containing protein n=1 Tax=Mycena venus TaxID=2733690 RepID=A0A8H6YU94_9AGAR|nr:hypothetical protein MVEN_00361100 [Mycena venus]
MTLSPKALCSLSTSKDTENFFAVIIAINDARHFFSVYLQAHELPPLEGAVNDGRRYKSFLLDDLHVPSSNIVLLENSSATRANILSVIQSHLRDNPNIPDHTDVSPDNREVTILVVFAGHGSFIDAPENVAAPDGQIEVICPADERTTNAVGEYVHAIPDYVLRRLLCGIAAKKGANITVILDCCHSGGMDRDVEVTRAARSISCSIPLDLDNQLWKGEKYAVPYRLWAKSTTPYVMLAACRSDEKASEAKNSDGTHGGYFTTNFLPYLQQAPRHHTTYIELMNQVPKLRGQSPQCFGPRRSRPIFGGSHPATGRRSVLLTPRKPRILSDSSPYPSSGWFRVEMGTVEGVLPETEFLVYDPNNNSVLCTLFVQSMLVGHTILIGKDNPPVDIPRWSRAVVSDWKSSPVLVYTRGDFPQRPDLFVKYSTQSPRFLPAPSPEKAQIIVRSDGDEIVVEICSQKMPRVPKETRFMLKGNPAHLPEAIEGIARFDYFLACYNNTDPLQGLGLEMYRLQGVYPARSPDPRKNLVKEGEVLLTSDVGANYGFTIRNDSCHDLFPHLFFFDPETKTIQPWYLPAGPRINPPLPSGGIVTLGMGSDPSFEFTLSPGELSSCGYLKLFVTKDYVDLGWMEQELSPFDQHFEGTGRLRMSEEPLNFMSTIWDALTVTVTINSRPDSANR